MDRFFSRRDFGNCWEKLKMWLIMEMGLGGVIKTKLLESDHRQNLPVEHSWNNKCTVLLPFANTDKEIVTTRFIRNGEVY